MKKIVCLESIIYCINSIGIGTMLGMGTISDEHSSITLIVI